MDLTHIIEPKTIALFGISKTNPNNPANIIYHKNVHRHCTQIFGINPSGGEYHGTPIYRSVADVPGPVDCAVFAIKAEYIPKAMRDCIQAGVKGGLVISGGFAEAGNQGLQDEIAAISRQNHFPIIGPNGLGVYSVPEINTFFFPDERFVKPLKGTIGLASQSGGILVDLMIRFTHEQIGISRALSIGNKAVVDEVEALRFFRDDERTSVIGIYFEGLDPGRGRIFIDEIQKTAKPVVLFKTGKTPASQSAISSHTASMAGDYVVFNEVIKQTEALEVEDEPRFLTACEVLARYGKRKINTAAIITMSGGHGVIASDFCYEQGIHVPPFPEADGRELKSLVSGNIRNIASFVNPIDLTGSAVDGDYLVSTRYALEREDIDCVLLLFLPFIPAITSALPPQLGYLQKLYDKPIVCYVPYLPKFGIFIEGFEMNGIPVTHSIDQAVFMLTAIKRRHI